MGHAPRCCEPEAAQAAYVTQNCFKAPGSQLAQVLSDNVRSSVAAEGGS